MLKFFSMLSSWRTALSTLVLSAHGHHGGSKRSAAIGAILLVAAMFVACGDDDSDFATRPSDGSSSLSSSSTKSSGSVYRSGPCKVVTDENCFKDGRDGQTYKTVKIGDQVWMAQNLNFETDSSFCFNDSVEYCEKFGRLYTWAAVMDSAGSFSTNGRGCGNSMTGTCSPTYPVRGICPDGWHLPTQAEWNTLLTAVGGVSTAGSKLKSTSGWNDHDGESGNGTDAFSFSVLPGGFRSGYGGYELEGYYAVFWSSTEDDNAGAYAVGLGYFYGNANLAPAFKGYGYSVRCLKDDP